jgi:glutamine amidotransferase
VSALVIVDSGGANLGSVRAALFRLGVDAPVTLDPGLIRQAGRVLLPGVGAAGPVMQRLRDAGLVDILRGLRQPLLGICVGMQALFEWSEEGDVECLGLLAGTVTRLPERPGVRIPHMGWNRLRLESDSLLLEGIDDGEFAYFVHGYAARGQHNRIASASHGVTFTAAVARGNVAGVQFHPERSGAAGARLLRNFMEWTPCPQPA